MYYYEILHDMTASVFMPAIKAGIYADRLAPVDMPALSARCERIWRDDGGPIIYWKHRNCEPPVDMKEFSWIKLTARKLP